MEKNHRPAQIPYVERYINQGAIQVKYGSGPDEGYYWMQVFDRRLEQLFGPSGEDMDLASRFTVDANGLGMFLSVYSGARSRGNVRAAGNQRVGIEVMANFMRAFGVEKSFVKDMVES